MKVALLQAPFIPMNLATCGGLERVEIEEVAGLRKRGMDVNLFVSEVMGKIKRRPKWIHIIRDWDWRNRFLKWKYLFEFVLINRKAKVLHGHYTPALAMLAPNRSLVHFHGLAVSELPFYRYKFARHRYHQARYVFCARHVRDSFATRYPNIPKKCLYVLYNGIDADHFKPSNLSRKPGPIRFSFHGRWVEHKGILELIEAVRLLEDKGYEFECHIAGSAAVGCAGEKADEFERIVYKKAEGLHSIHFVGPIKYAKLPRFLQGMDFGVVPSIYPDPFPLAPLEVMACGLPVVAYDIGGLKEMILNMMNGLLVDNNSTKYLADSIKYLIDHEHKRITMGKNAREHILKFFTWDKHIESLMAIYFNINKV